VPEQANPYGLPIGEQINGGGYYPSDFANFSQGMQRRPTYVPPNEANPLTSGIKTGYNELVGSLGSAVAATGKLTGISGLRSYGESVAAARKEAAEASGRSDLEVAPWQEGGASVLPWVGYQAAKMIPSVAGMVVGSKVVPKSFVPKGLATLGEKVPLVGGAGLTGEAATAAGQHFAQGTIAGTLVGAPMMVGQNYQAAADQPGGAMQGDAAKAFLAGIPEAALGSLFPTKLAALSKAAEGASLHKRVLTGIATAGPIQGVQAGVQTAVTQQFGDPSMTAGDRAKGIIDSVLTGAVMGGVMGGAAGAAGGRKAPPTPEEQIAAVDSVIRPPEPPAPIPPVAPGPDGQGALGGMGDPATARPHQALAPEELTQQVTDLVGNRQRTPEQETQLGALRAEARARRPYANTDPEELTKQLTELSINKKRTPEQTAAYNNLRAEVLARAKDNIGEGQRSLLDPDQSADRAAKVEEMRQSLIDKAGPDNREDPFIQDMQASNRPELINELKRTSMEYARDGITPPDWLEKQLQEHGIDQKLDVKLKGHEKKLAGHQADFDENMRLATKYKLDEVDGPKFFEKANEVKDGPLAKEQQNIDDTKALMADHALADKMEAMPVRKVPDRVRPGAWSKAWGAVESVRHLIKSSDSRLRMFGDSAHEIQGAIERNHPNAVNRANKVVQDVKAYVEKKYPEGRPRFEMDSDPNAPKPEEVVEPVVEAKAPVDEEAAAAAEQKAVEDSPDLTDLTSKVFTGLTFHEDPVAGNLGNPDVPNPSKAAPARIMDAQYDADRARAGELLNDKVNPLSEDVRARLETALEDTNNPQDVSHILQEHEDRLKTYGERLDPAADVAAIFGRRKTPPPERPELMDPLQKLPEVAGDAASEHPEWAQKHARSLINARVAYSDANYALLEATSAATGRPLYAPVNRASGYHLRADVTDPGAAQVIPSAIDRAKLVATRNKLLAEYDRKVAAADPDGPFTGAKQNVVRTESVDPRVAGIVAGVTRMLGYGKIRIMLMDPKDIAQQGERYRLLGDYARPLAADPARNGEVAPFGPSDRDFYIAVDTSKSIPMQIETLGHEIGHIAKLVSFDNAPQTTRDAVHDAFGKFLIATQGKSDAEVIMATRNRESAATHISDLKARGASAEMSYYKSFGEWFADQTSRWVTTAEKPRGVIQQFFYDVAQKMKDVLSSLTGRTYHPDAEVAKFLDGLGPGSAKSWEGLDLKQRNSKGFAQYDMATEAERAPQTPQEQNVRVKNVVGDVERFAIKVYDMMPKVIQSGLTNINASMKNMFFGAATSGHIGEVFRTLAPALMQHVEFQKIRSVLEDVFQQPGKRAMQAYDKLPEGGQMLVKKLMSYTALGIDPRRSWAEQPQLHNAKNRVELAKQVELAHSEWGQLNRVAGGADAYTNLHVSNLGGQMARLSSLLSNHVWRGYDEKNIPGFTTNPFEEYRFRADLHDSPAGSADFWKVKLDEQVKGAQAHIDSVLGEAAKLDEKDPKRKELASSVSSLQEALGTVEKGIKLTQGAPYFHMGRHGEFFAGAHFTVGKDGLVDPKHVDALQAALDAAGLGDVVLQRAAENASIFMRVDTLAQAQDLERILVKLRDEKGVISKDPKKQISAGLPEYVNTKVQMLPSWVQAEVEARMSSMHMELPDGASDQQKAVYATAQSKFRSDLVKQYLDILPENAIEKMLARRKNTQGADADMIRSFADRNAADGRATASTAMMKDLGGAMNKIRSEVQELKSRQDIGLPQRVAAHQAASELALREMQRQWDIKAPLADMLQSWGHVAYVGTSPAYVLMPLMQIGTLSWPQLAKNHGYMQSALALARAGTPAIQVMRAIFSGPDGSAVGFSHKALTEYGGISQKNVDFIMRHSNMGNLNLGTNTRANYHISEGATPGQMKAKQWASAMGSYAEMLPRVLTILAARDLYEQKPPAKMTLDQFVTRAVQESQLDWNSVNNPRYTGKAGLVGPASKVAFQFTGFQSRMIETYHREILDMFGRNGPEEAKEARKFVGAHLAAMTVLAGSLGLPAAGMIAGVADKLGDVLGGREDTDVQASYRVWLAHTFGPDVGAVLARGVPRAFGVDLAHHGEQHLIPGTALMQEKRKFEDSEAMWAKNMMGATPNMMARAYLGTRDILGGDYLNGLQKILPSILKNPLEAYRMSEHGYVDNNGTPLPLTPGATQIMMQALGLQNGAKADYDEKKDTQVGLEVRRSFVSQNISRRLEVALHNKDAAARDEQMRKAAEFVQRNPGVSSPAENYGRSYQKHAIEAAIAASANGTLGMNPKIRNDMRRSDY
jgi:hypothetical protein